MGAEVAGRYDELIECGRLTSEVEISMTLNIFGRTGLNEKRTDAPGAHVDDQDQSLDVGTLTEDSGSQTRDDEAASPTGKTYLETLYPEN